MKHIQIEQSSIYTKLYNATIPICLNFCYYVLIRWRQMYKNMAQMAGTEVY